MTTAARGLGASHLTVAYEDRPILRDLSLTLPEGRFTAILGPNGCGKSTLLKTFARLIRPRAGQVTLDGMDLHALPPRKVAQQLGLLPQAPIAPDGITVSDLVARGRAPWRGLLSGWSQQDETARSHAMQATGVCEFADRPVAELSGGQRQRVWIALALAQETRHLLLDEPTTWLDLPHQIEVLRLLQQLNRASGRSIVAVLHDLSLAARYADHLVLLAPGRLVATGTAAAVLTPDNLADAFGMEAVILDDPISGTPIIVPK
ncbi:ABC transporter ATP-binding protein [Paracoccus sp. (in: a-proteobacteria)]|uniref:ABC transporter ATP-binding protein n=1 Tax=Paracoccus sp. TaxID=267 RepID=UPI0028AE7333|nr:ABC transporter ATP-binding protein [Paracoccus sp. (in: a-proteobacteria)]